ncbi:MAG: nitrile hydratase subunit beta [Alphaproteobacteria bacterium]|nr:nitrile hydratase subunit beta [Alphaproteobacteria bacterium]
MDGIHDLGGREGFGPIDADEDEQPFHAPWEARLNGMVRAISRAPDWTIDWFRHCRELIDPVDYLTRPYYDQWMQTYAAMMIVSGLATVDELAGGRATTRADLPPPMTAAGVAAAKARAVRYDRPGAATPAFAVGDAVVARRDGHAGHTRLPAYARGRRGTIAASHGAFVLPDQGALARDAAEPLYTVSFPTSELWAEAAGRRDTVLLDLWQSYLTKA